MRDVNGGTGEAKPAEGEVLRRRLAFFVFGLFLAIAPKLADYFGEPMDAPFKWICLGTGVTLSILGILLPPRIVAAIGYGPTPLVPDRD